MGDCGCNSDTRFKVLVNIYNSLTKTIDQYLDQKIDYFYARQALDNGDKTKYKHLEAYWIDRSFTVVLHPVVKQYERYMTSPKFSKYIKMVEDTIRKIVIKYRWNKVPNKHHPNKEETYTLWDKCCKKKNKLLELIQVKKIPLKQILQEKKLGYFCHGWQ